jgi:putative endonuclease
VGSTVDLQLRVRQHKEKRFKNAFTALYRFTRLAYFEVLPDAAAAEARETEIKGWTRAKKVALIQSINPRSDLTPRLSDLSFLG